EILVVQLVLGGVEGGRQAPPAACGLGNDLELLRARLPEQDRLLGPFDCCAEPGQRDRLAMGLHLVQVDPSAHEPTPPELFDIDADGGTRFHRLLCFQSALAPENLTTLAHFSVSSATSFANSAGEPGRSDAPRSANRALALGSARMALISWLSRLTISSGVPR